MKRSDGLGFGAFLLGLGVGWLVLRNYQVSTNLFAWIVIIAGIGIVFSSIISWMRPAINFGGVVSGLMGGIILSLFLTAGFGFFTDIFNPSGSSLQYRAEDTKLFTGMAVEPKILLEVDNFNGPVYVSSEDNNEYSVNLTIKAKGTTTSDAEKNLEKLKINFDDQVVGDQMKLTLRYDIPLTEQRKYSVIVDVKLPSQAVIDLDLESSNGGMSLKNIEGETIRIETSNGALSFDNVYAESINCKTSNGAIEGDLEGVETILSTSNGRIELTLPCAVSGRYSIDTSNGGIRLTLCSSTEVGYDIELSTSNGDVDIELQDLDYTVDKRTDKDARTTGFNEKAVQIIVDASTSNGNIDLET